MFVLIDITVGFVSPLYSVAENDSISVCVELSSIPAEGSEVNIVVSLTPVNYTAGV